MEASDREALQKCRSQIVQDLDVRLIIDVLIEKRILDDEASELILTQVTLKDKARKLLDILPLRGPNAFSVFLDSLREDYDWLVDDLELGGDDFEKGKFIDESEVDGEQQVESRLNDILMRGGVPSRPSHNIVREDRVKQVKQLLNKLDRGSFVAIHGMPGSGKSVLAAESLRDPDLTLACFPNGVFWFRVGVLEMDKLLNRLKILLEKLDAPSVPTSVEHAQEIMRKMFMSDGYSKCLLILDDVWNADIIKAFNVCCRVLVTTQDISIFDVLPNHKYSVVEIQSGFTEQESLQLFSSYVDIPVEYLPEEAKQIHAECKGSPMVVSMIGGLISESGKHSQRQRQSGRWIYYLHNLKARRYSKFHKQRSYEHQSLTEAVMLSVENVEDKYKEKYKQLAVFLDDVDIPQKVLMTYWGVDEFDVDDIMTVFCRKSLAESTFDQLLDTHVYHIHDLQLDYLKSSLRDKSEDKEKEMHQHFLEQYFKKANYQYGNIEDDSYIFYNFGYHLFKSEQFDLFPKIYLDLSFVEAMLKATSSVDLLNDYKRYGDQIIGLNDEYLQDLEDYEAFARTVGALVSTTQHTDIIQLALREPAVSAVYRAALKLAHKRPQTLYFEWVNRDSTRSQHSATILHHGIVEDAFFLPDITKILTSNGEGQIKVWDVTSGEVLHRFTGHKGSVKTLALSPSGDKFASGSEDGAVKIWDLGSFVDDSENGPSTQHAILRKGSVKGRSHHLRPYTKQTVNHMLTFDHDLRDLSNQSFIFNELHHEMVLCVDFSSDSERVVASGTSGHVKVFSMKSRSLQLSLTGHKFAVNVCRFSPDGKTICTGSDDNSVRLFDAESGEFKGSFNKHGVRVTHLVFLPHLQSSQVISMSADKLIMWDSPETPSSPMNMVEFNRTRSANFVCMKVCSSGQLLAAGTVDNMVTVWMIDTREVILSLPGHNDDIYTLDFTPDNSFLLSGSADETVMIWNVEELPSSMDSYYSRGPSNNFSLGPAFDVKFVNGSRQAVLVAPDDTNCLRVLHDGYNVYQSPAEVSLITCVCLSDNGQVVAYGCSNGAVRLYYPASATVKNLGTHNKCVKVIASTTSVLEDQMETVVAVTGSADGSVRIWWDGGKAIQCNHEHKTQVRQVCVLNNKVLSRSSCALNMFNLVTGEHVAHFAPDDDDHINFMDIVQDKVAVGTSSGLVYVLQLQGFDKVVVLKPNPGYGPVRVCRLSHDGKLLVTGHDTGTMEIWDVQSGAKMYHPLRMHESWVTDIQFASDNIHMVSVGDKIAWWCLEHMTRRKANSTHKRKSSGLFSRRPRIDSESRSDFGDIVSISAAEAATSTKSPNNKYEFTQVPKSGTNKTEELLQLFDIRGSSIRRIHVSSDFKRFVTIDDAGIPYILDEILPQAFFSCRPTDL